MDGIQGDWRNGPFSFFIVNCLFLRFNTVKIYVLQIVAGFFGVFPQAEGPGFYSRMRRDVMQCQALIICMCLTLFLPFGGCSQDEEPLPPLRGNKVVKPIKRPAPPPPEKAKTSPTPSVGLRRPEPEEKKTEKAKTAPVSTKVSEKVDIRAGEKKIPSKTEPGYYVVKKGDSLESIAGRPDVYGDPLKWPILCRFNMDKLGKMQAGEDFVDRNLPEGTRLKIVTPAEKKENLKTRANNVWVVNVLSTPNKKEIIPATVKLVEKGYTAYITRTEVKGKDYMRLRVGFFGNKAQADAEGKNIKALLNLGEPWKTKAGEEEFKDFGGY